MNPSEHFYNSIANLIKLNPHWIPATVDAVQTSTSAAWEKQDIRQRGAGQHRKLVNTVIRQAWEQLFQEAGEGWLSHWSLQDTSH